MTLLSRGTTLLRTSFASDDKGKQHDAAYRANVLLLMLAAATLTMGYQFINSPLILSTVITQLA